MKTAKEILEEVYTVDIKELSIALLELWELEIRKDQMERDRKRVISIIEHSEI